MFQQASVADDARFTREALPIRSLCENFPSAGSSRNKVFFIWGSRSARSGIARDGTFMSILLLSAIIGAVGKEVFDEGPASADRMQDELGTRTVGDIEATEPPIHRLPRWEVVRQHAPATTGTRRVAEGMKLGDDADEIDLDVTLEKFELTRAFLMKILGQFAKHCQVNLAVVIADGAKDRLILASGGVARDFLTIFGRAIEVAKEPYRSYPRW
jgi:hypothetical protein